MFTRFEQFLVSNGSIVPKQIPYYVKWVTDCYTVCKCPADKILAADHKKQYLGHLENIRESNRLNRLYGSIRSFFHAIV